MMRGDSRADVLALRPPWPSADRNIGYGKGHLGAMARTAMLTPGDQGEEVSQRGGPSQRFDGEVWLAAISTSTHERKKITSSRNVPGEGR